MPSSPLLRLGFELLDVLDDPSRVAREQLGAGAFEYDVHDPALRRALEVALPDHLDPTATRCGSRCQPPPASLGVVDVGVFDVGEDRVRSRPVVVATLP